MTVSQIILGHQDPNFINCEKIMFFTWYLSPVRRVPILIFWFVSIFFCCCIMFSNDRDFNILLFSCGNVLNFCIRDISDELYLLNSILFHENAMNAPFKGYRTYTYIIGHYNSSVRIIDLVSHTTYVHKWRDLQFKIDSERQLFWETFHGNFDLLSEFLPQICWEEIAEEILFVFRQHNTLPTRPRWPPGPKCMHYLKLLLNAYDLLKFENYEKKCFIFYRIRICMTLRFKSFTTPCSSDRKCKK